MKTLLFCCPLWALLETGTCVSCEVCSSMHKECTGPLQVCSEEPDSYGIIRSVQDTLNQPRTQGETKNVNFAKACISSSECSLALLYMTFGNGISFSGNVTCCVGEACKTATVSVPLANTTVNGRCCPACYSVLSHHYKEEIIDCTGAQTHCLHVSGTVKNGGTTVKTTMKGCTSESTCTNMQQFKGTFRGLGADLTTGECSPASSCVATVALEPAGLVLSALLTVLLVNVLS